MNRDRILQVRLDPQLADQLRAFTEELRAADRGANESTAARILLRRALSETVHVVTANDAGYNEGLRRGYNDARAALRKAFEHLFDGGGR